MPAIKHSVANVCRATRSRMPSALIVGHHTLCTAAAVSGKPVVRNGGIGPVGCATLAYIALQAAYLLWKWHRDRRRE